MVFQGDFDPTKTKVVHFAGNPLALSRKIHAQEVDNLREENDDLHRKIRQLEQHGASIGAENVDRNADKEIEGSLLSSHARNLSQSSLTPSHQQI